MVQQKTPEEVAIESFKSLYKITLIPEPNRGFEVGEKVHVGNLKNCKIVKPLFDKKAYLIEYTSTDNNYGNPIYKKGQLSVWSWIKIFKITNRTESFIEDEGSFLQYHQSGMSAIFAKIYSFGVDMNPKYQRDYVWSEEDKISLIDSIYKNVDIGKFVFVFNSYEGEFMEEILDGKQRINAIKEFYEDKLLYNGLKFSELSVRDRSHFENYTVNICQVSECSLKEKLKIFYKLNISGKVMDKEHLEKIKKMRMNLEVKK